MLGEVNLKRYNDIIERALLVGISVGTGLAICNLFNLSKFYAGIASLNVANLSDAKTRRQAYERTVTTFCGGAVACIIAYSGYQENMFFYLIGLIIVCCFIEKIVKVPATVGCIAFTYIMLNIDPNKTPNFYLTERVLGTFVGAVVVASIVTIYNRLRKKKKEYLEKYPQKNIIYHVQRGFLPGIAVIIGVLIINVLNRFIPSHYVTRYTMYYCALASVVPYHVELKELLHKTKERVVSTIFGGVIAFIFVNLNLNGVFWTSIGIMLVIIFIESFIKVGASLGGIVFLFVMVNMSGTLTPFVYYIDRVVGTIIGVVILIFIAYIFQKLKLKFKSENSWKIS